MLSRVFALFLASVLFWSALGTIEGVSTWAQQSSVQQPALADAGALPSAGSVMDHHLDDLPSQAQSDPPAETPDLLPALSRPSDRFHAGAQRHCVRSAAAGSPFLVGPMRPPCSEALTA